MPTLFLSLAAAAAAAEAYLSPSPGGLGGRDAGFMLELDDTLPLVTLARGLCSVANVGSGDFSCAEGLRAAAGSIAAALALAGKLAGRGSESSKSSCTDCVSWEDTRSLSWFMP